MDASDALRVLGLQGPADARTVKASYRRLARTLHPDAGGDAALFLTVQAAYDQIANGTEATTGQPPPQTHAAGVANRWWDTPGVWHEDPVESLGIDLSVTPSGAPAERCSLDLLASMLARATPIAEVTLRSRAPGSRLHRVISMLEPDLMASLHLAPARDGARHGHDVEVELRATAGRGRRIAGTAPVPSGWTRRRGSESVRVVRTLRPSVTPTDTAVRVARAVYELTTSLGWPLDEWFVLGESRPLARRP
jgi:hypothetical protein